MSGFRTCDGVSQLVSESAYKNAGFSFAGSEFLYGVYNNQHRAPFQLLGAQAMSGWTASENREKPSAGIETFANLPPSNCSSRSPSGTGSSALGAGPSGCRAPGSR